MGGLWTKNSDQDALPSLNMNTLEIQSEFLRLDAPKPSDVQVAVLGGTSILLIDIIS